MFRILPSLLLSFAFALSASGSMLAQDGVHHLMHGEGATTAYTPSPSESGLILQMTFPEPEVETIDGQTILRLAGEGLMGEAGFPDLPLVVRLVRVPAESKVEVSTSSLRWESLGAHRIRPNQDRLHTEIELPLPWIMDEETYSSDTSWPATVVRLSEPMLLRETRLVKLAVAPFRWNPISGDLEVLREIKVTLSFNGSSDVNRPLRGSKDEGASDDDEGLVYEIKKAEHDFVGQLLGDALINPFADDDDEGSIRTIDWSSPNLPLNYLVFVREALLSQSPLQDLLEWKRAKGHNVKIFTEDTLGASWSYTNIRNAIIDEYTDSDKPPHYVMLVGDTSGSYAVPTHNSRFDHYYSTIAGNDILADVVVGRVSVASATDLATVCNKIMGYEQNPYLDDPDWLQRASFLTGTNHCGLSMSQLSRSIAFQLVEDRGYTQIDTAFCASSPSYVYNWFNQGISFYNYRGWIGMEGLSTSTLLNLTQGPRTPIAVVFTCSSGDFADNGVAYSEAFFRGGTPSTAGGAAAAMGFCTWNTHTAYNNVVCGGFWTGMLDYGIQQVGTCMFRGKLELFLTLPPGDGNISNFAYWANLMGDPGMEMNCGIPERLVFGDLAESIHENAQVIEVLVLNENTGMPVEDAAVCASQPDGQQVVVLTNENGQAWLPLALSVDLGELSLVATSPRLIPAIEELELLNATGQPVIDNLVLDDENENGRWEFGETAEISARIINHSLVALPACEVSLEARMDGSIIMLDNAGSLAALEPGASADLDGLFRATVASDFTDGLPLELFWHFHAEEEEWLLPLSFDLSGPRLSLTSATLSGGLNPGESNALEMRLTNDGDLLTDELVIDASFEEGSLMSIETSHFEFGTVDPEAQVNLAPLLSASSDLVPGFTDHLFLDWSTAEGSSGRIIVPVTLGSLVPSDPTGPDAYGYYAYESTDALWSMAPVYNWIEIAPNAGGTGTIIDLDDNGDEQDDARRVNLPFPVAVYGEIYESMSVCSNGFVAFGPTAHLETDFRNHAMPCGMGPEPMLAPMWDDHKLTNDAQVCVEHLEEDGLYVVEWFRMRTNSNNRVNTFQLILFDPAVYPTLTGDAEILYQYHTFDDHQSNSQDFPYCTIGLKNQTATVGLNLRNYQQMPSTMTGVSDGTAIRLTTTVGMAAPPPIMVLDDSPILIELSNEASEVHLDSILINNDGVAALTWQAQILPDPTWPPVAMMAGSNESRDGGGPDSYGYTWLDSDETGGPDVGWVEMTDAQAVDFTDNDGSEGPYEIGFEFPYYGEVFTEFWVAANGFLCFEEPQYDYWQNNQGLPSSNAPEMAIFPWWDDLLTTDQLTGFVSYATSNDSLIVSWIDAPHYSDINYGGPFTFQIVLEPNGSISFNYGEMADDNSDSDSGTIGLQGRDLAALLIRHMDISTNDHSIRVVPPFWLSLSNNVGILPGNGGSTSIVLSSTNSPAGALIPDGDYSATLHVTSNDPLNNEAFIDVTLRVGTVDIQDAVSLPDHFVLGNAYPNPFNPTTRVQFQLPSATRVKACLYNLMGQEVATLINNRPMQAGNHQLTIDGTALSSGLYLLQMEAGTESAVRKVMLVK